MIIDDILKVTLSGQMNAMQTINRFYYQVKTAVTGVITLAELFRDEVLEPLTLVQANNVDYNYIDIENLNNIEEAARLPVVSQGVLVGETLPSYAALSIRLVTESKVIRDGGKRFAGLIEANVNGNTYLNGYIADVANFVPTLVMNLVDDVSDAVFVPVLYTTGNKRTEIPYATAITDAFINSPSTQSSRKNLYKVNLSL